MKITLDIEDSKAGFLIELLQSLDYVTVNAQYEIPEWHKEIVLDRVNDPDAKFIEEDEMFRKLDKEFL